MVGVILGLLAEVVFNSTQFMQRSFAADMQRYFDERGLGEKPARRQRLTR